MRGAPLNGFTLFLSGGARKVGTGDQIIIDRDKDAVLQNELSWAGDLRNLPEDEKGLLIAQRVRNLLGHPQSEEIISGLEQNGERLLIGDLAQKHKAGVCRHRALLFHTLAKEAGLDSAMIHGMMSDRGADVGHTWNEIAYANGERVVVDTAMPPYPTFQYLNPEAFRRSGGFPKVGGTKQGRQYYFGRPEGGKIGVQYTT